MSKEALAAGLTAAAAAISASPSARRKIRDAGLDAADKASLAASKTITNASKLGSLIAEAVADAAERVKSGRWVENDQSNPSNKKLARGSAKTTGKSRSSTPQKSKAAGGARYEVTITEGLNLGDRAIAELVSDVEIMIAQSGDPTNFDAAKWVHDWIRQQVPALGNKRPIDLLDTPEGRAQVSATLGRMQSGAYA